MEGGSDQDLRVLDVVTSSSNTTVENDDGEDEILKPSTNINEPIVSEKAESSTSVVADDSKKSPENKV